MKIKVLIITLIFQISCNSKDNQCLNNDKECLISKKNNHSITKLNYWDQYFKKDINKRVFIAPKELIDYIKIDNKINKYNTNPTTPNNIDSFIKDVGQAMTEIPESVKALFQNKLAGVFLVNNLGSTGFSDYILDEEGSPVASFIVLNYDSLATKPANAWLSWRESTPFHKDREIKIESVIALPQDNNRKNAIQFILLHELGHVVSVNDFFHPPWDILPNDVHNINHYPFFNESWKVQQTNNKYTSIFDNTFFKRRKLITYYKDPKLRGNQAFEVYSSLEKTNFVTLYGATSPFEDWAESFATYVHSILLKRPFEINIFQSGQLYKKFTLCWGSSRCYKKELFLKKLLNQTTYEN